MLTRAVGFKSSPNPEMINQGDVLGLAEVISSLTTVGAGSVTGAMIATGILRRTGPVGGFTDTFDSAANILTALAGSDFAAKVAQGTTWRFRYINAVAQAMTFAAGIGVVSGTGTLTVAASVIRDYLLTVLSAQTPISLNAVMNGTAAVTFVLPSGLSAFKMGPAPDAVNIQYGATVSGTNITAGTTVIGVTQGQGGITGVTLSAVASGSGTNSIAFGPTVQIDSLGSLAA